MATKNEQTCGYSPRTWRVFAMVISADKHAGTIADDGRAKDLGGAQDGTVDRSLIAIDVVYYLIFGIEDEDAHLLVIKVGHLHHNQVGGVSRGLDLVFLITLQYTEPSSY